MAILSLHEMTPDQIAELERRYDSLLALENRPRIDMDEVRRRMMKGCAKINRRRRGWRDGTDERCAVVTDPALLERDNTVELIGALTSVLLNRGRLNTIRRRRQMLLDDMRKRAAMPVVRLAAE